MKVQGTFTDPKGIQLILTMDLPQIPDTDMGDFPNESQDDIQNLFQPIIDHMAVSLGTILGLSAPLMLVAIDMLGESCAEAVNTGLAMEERAQAGEDAKQIYLEYCQRRMPEYFGDMVETENPDAFSDFIEGSLNVKKLDEDGEV